MSRIIPSQAKPNIALATHVEKMDIWVKIVPKGKSPNSNLVHYDFTKLRKDQTGTCAIRVIESPRTSIRAIWVPKHLVSNLHGLNKVWVPKGTC